MQPINTALCSFGMSGKLFHAPFIQLNANLNFYAVVERSKQLAVEFYPDVKTYTSLEQMLADEKVELVVVNTPNYTHFDFAKQALQAGKHVIVEKPFTSTAKEAAALIDLAKQKNKMLSVFQNRRWDSDFKTVKKVISKGLLGKIVEVEMHYDRYNLQLSQKLHKEEPGPARGVLFDLGSHLIDQALHLFGLPEKIFGDLDALRPNSKVQDYMELLLLYTDCRVRLKAGYIVKEPPPAYIVHGMKGSFLKSRADIQEGLLLKGAQPGGETWGMEPDTEKGLLHYEKDSTDVREKIDTERGNYGEYYQLIADAIRGNKPPPVTGEDGLNVMKVIEASVESHEQQKVISIR